MLTGWGYLPEIMLILITLINVFSWPLKYRHGLLLLFLGSILYALGQTGWDPTLVLGWTAWESWFRYTILILTGLLLWTHQESSPEEYILISLLGLSSTFMCQCHQWVEFFVWMELQTLTLFVLIARKTLSVLSTEAGIKYFVLAAFASGLFLFGVALQYQTWGHLAFQQTALWGWTLWPFASTLITSALLFKMAIVPFHQWVPDIYEGSSWTTLILLSSLPKLGILAILVKLGLPNHLLYGVALLSIVLGALGAMNQVKLKRLVGYSTIAHSGFIFLALSLGSTLGYQLAALYLLVYLLTFLLLAFLAQGYLPGPSPLIYWPGLRLKHPWISFSLVVTLFSMAGIPPLGGFLIKWGVLSSLTLTHQTGLAFLALLGATLGVGYYLRLVKTLYFEPASQWSLWQVNLASFQLSWTISYTISWLVFFTLSLLVFPSWLLDTLSWASLCIV